MQKRMDSISVLAFTHNNRTVSPTYCHSVVKPESGDDNVFRASIFSQLMETIEGLKSHLVSGSERSERSEASRRPSSFS